MIPQRVGRIEDVVSGVGGLESGVPEERFPMVTMRGVTPAGGLPG